jgi:hypothetical protein
MCVLSVVVLMYDFHGRWMVTESAKFGVSVPFWSAIWCEVGVEFQIFVYGYLCKCHLV